MEDKYKQTRDKENERIRQWRKENPDKARAIRERWLEKSGYKSTERVTQWRKENPDKAREARKRNRLKSKHRTEAYRSQCWLDSFLQNDIAECIAFYNDDCI